MKKDVGSVVHLKIRERMCACSRGCIINSMGLQQLSGLKEDVLEAWSFLVLSLFVLCVFRFFIINYVIYSRVCVM